MCALGGNGKLARAKEKVKESAVMSRTSMREKKTKLGKV